MKILCSRFRNHSSRGFQPALQLDGCRISHARALQAWINIQAPGRPGRTAAILLSLLMAPMSSHGPRLQEEVALGLCCCQLWHLGDLSGVLETQSLREMPAATWLRCSYPTPFSSIPVASRRESMLPEC